MEKRLLVVDDDPTVRALLTAILKPLECTIAQVGSGREALDALGKERFEVVLLDIMMPGMDGHEVLRAIRQRPEWAGLAVVMITAAADREARMRGFEGGADEFLEKPVDRGLLLTRVRTLMRLREARDQVLERARAVEALSHERSELVNLIVHDLKNPLSAIRANLEYLDKLGGLTRADAKEALLDADAAGRRMQGLIQDILSVERMDQAELRIRRQDLNIATLVEEVARSHRRQAELQQLQLNARLPVEGNTVSADGELIRRVVENLVDNALHHTPPHGAIEVLFENEADWSLTISNTGNPIPDDIREHIFDKFVRGPEFSPYRFGLGLYFCKRVADAHDGSLMVFDRPGWPVSFRFAVPNTRTAGHGA